MGFLDKINAAKNPATTAEKKVNPLLKRPAPVMTATILTEKPAPLVPNTTTKINPFLKKAAVPAATELPKKR